MYELCHAPLSPRAPCGSVGEPRDPTGPRPRLSYRRFLYVRAYTFARVPLRSPVAPLPPRPCKGFIADSTICAEISVFREFQNFLEFRNFGISEFWNLGILEFWNFGILEF